MASIYKRGGVWYIYYRVDGHRARRRVSRSEKKSAGGAGPSRGAGA